MENNEKYSNILFEKIYDGYSDDDDKVSSSIQSFFIELINRRKDIPVEVGLQGSMVIFDSSFASKVNEKDGTSPHLTELINLTRYLNGEKNFLTDYGNKFYKLRAKDEFFLRENGLEVRIISSSHNLQIVILSNKSVKSLFQLKILRIINEICQLLMDKKIYKDINIGIHTNEMDVPFGNWNNGKFNLINDAIESERNRLQKTCYNK